jgi:hypothetical protein
MQEMRKDRKEADHVGLLVLLRNSESIRDLETPVGPLDQVARVAKQVRHNVDSQVLSFEKLREGVCKTA